MGTSPGLPGEATLLASWAALATTSAGASVVDTGRATAAVFPAWLPLNNAVLTGAPTAAAAAAVEDLAPRYAAAGARSWALWLPSPVADLEPDRDALQSVDGLSRDTTTLVMTRSLSSEEGTATGAIRTSASAASEAGDAPVSIDGLPAPDGVDGLCGWVLRVGDVAVVGAWAYVHGDDVGVYAVGTAPAYRRRGLAATLVRHVLTDAFRAGARTASLQSTAMGQGLYEALGFRARGRYEEWVWSGR